MKKLIPVIIFFMIAVPVMAVEQLQHDAWHYSQESVTINGIVFYMDLGFSGEKVYLRFNNKTDFVPLGTCKVIDQTNFVVKACYSDTEWDIESKKMKIKMQFYSRLPDLRITRTIEQDELTIGDESDITIKIKNEGSNSALNITLTDYFPEGVEIIEVDGMKIVGNATVWERGFLNPGEERELSYTIKAVGTFNMKLKAFLTYFDGLSMQEMYSEPFMIRSKDFVSLNSMLADEIYSGQEANFTINISSSANEEITVDYLEILFPKNLEVIRVPTRMSRVGENRYRWSDKLDSNRSKKFEFKIMGLSTGVADIQVNTQFELDEKKYSISNYIDSIRIKDRGIIVRSDLKEDNTIESYEKKNIRIWVQNLNSYSMIKDVRIKIDSPAMFVGDVYLRWMNASEQKKVADFTFKAPRIISSQSHELKVSVEYVTGFGDKGQGEETYTFSLIPLSSIEITQEFDKTQLEEEEQTDISVTVKNNRNTEIKKVRVYDIIDKRFIVKGLTSTVTNINKEDSQPIYQYRLTAPKVQKKEDICIETNVEYEDESGNYSYAKEKCITVKPREIELGLTKNIVESDVYQGQILNIKYDLTNNEDDKGDTAKRLVLEFPLSQAYDLMDQYSYSIDQLDPGETVKIENEEQLRIKLNGTSVEIPPSVLHFSDSDGNIFSKNTSALNIESKYATIFGPAILLNKTADSKRANTTHDFVYTLKVTNIGSEAAKNITIKDGAEEYTILSLPPKMTKEYPSKRRFYIPGKDIVAKATATYPCFQRKCMTASNEIDVDVTNTTIPEKQIEDIGANTTAHQAIEETPAEAPTEEQPQKNIFEKIADIIIWVFTYKRGE